MAGTVAITGPGAYGDLAPGWSIAEDVPPHTPGGNANSTGTAQFAVETKSDTVFLQNNPSVFSVTKPDGSSFGLLAGAITSVAPTGIRSSLTQGSALTRFNADRVIPPVGSGSPVAALDLAMQLTGTKFCTLPYTAGVYWSARGHDVGFDFNNNPVQGVDNSSTIAQTVALLSTIQQYPNVKNSLSISAYGQNTARSQYMYGSSPTVIPGFRTMVMYTDIALNYSNFQVTYGPSNYLYGQGKNLNVYVDKIAQTVTIKGVYINTAGVLVQVNVSTSIASQLTASTNVQILYDMNWVNSSTYNLTVYVANKATPGTYATVTTGNLTVGLDFYALRWNLAGIAEGIYTLDADQTFTPSVLMTTYDSASSYYTGGMVTFQPDSPIAQFSGTVWNYLSAVCSATSTEIYNYTTGGTSMPGIRPVALSSIAPESWQISPQVSISDQGLGQNVNIKNYNTSLIASRQIYDANLKGDTLSFPQAAVTKLTITSDNAIDFVFNPVALADYPTYSAQQTLAIDPTKGYRTNWVTNPDFETNVANWTANSSTLSQVSTPVVTGSGSMRITTTAVVNSGTSSNPVAYTSDWAGAPLVGTIAVNAPTGVVIQVQLKHLTSAGSSVVATTNITGLGGTLFNFVTLTGTMLSTATSGAYFTVLTTTTAAPVLYVDAAKIEISSADPTTLNNFTGNAISDVNTTYGWNGVANGSTSFAHPTGGQGAYVISDSNGVNVDPYAWISAGGSITASLLDSTHIQLTIIAPAMGNYAVGNLTLQSTSGATKIPTLSLVGSGVVSSPVVLAFPTGADPKFTTIINAPDVDNVAIGSAARANNAALLASTAASGPTISVNCGVNSDIFTGLGSIAGTTFVYQNQRWRVINSNINNLSASLTAIPYTTAADFEGQWSGKLVSDFETFWSANTNDDLNIQPMRNS